MIVKALVGLANQRAIETPRTASRLVTGNKQDGLPRGVEAERQPPMSIGHAEPHFLHVRVPGAVQRIHPGPSESWSEPLENARQGQDLRLHIDMQAVELRRELVGNLDGPTQSANYVLVDIWCQEHITQPMPAQRRNSLRPYPFGLRGLDLPGSDWSRSLPYSPRTTLPNPATGRQVTWASAAFFRCESGKITHSGCSEISRDFGVNSLW